MNRTSTSPWQFTLFRILFGGYLAIHLAMLVPYAAELFGHEGLMGDPSLNPAAGLFPNPLDLPLPPLLPEGILAGLAGLSVMFAAGLMRPAASLVLWFGWTALFHRNNLIANPSLPYVGLVLVLCALVPGGEPWSFSKRDEAWEMPRWIPRCAWILLAAGYTFSGITKLSSASWIDGSAMRHLLENPLARPGMVRDVMLSLPDIFLASMTWLTLLAELLFLPLCLWSRARPRVWLTLVLMHLSIIPVVDFADLSLGMLMIHAFTFDRRWIPSRYRSALVAYDAECLMCSRAIRFIAAEDVAARVKFITLQSDRGRAMEEVAGQRHLAGMVVEAGGRVTSKSGAVLSILSALGGVWRPLAIAGSLFPPRFRERLYDFVAANRYRWFGRTEACVMPSQAVRERIRETTRH